MKRHFPNILPLFLNVFSQIFLIAFEPLGWFHKPILMVSAALFAVCNVV